MARAQLVRSVRCARTSVFFSLSGRKDQQRLDTTVWTAEKLTAAEQLFVWTLSRARTPANYPLYTSKKHL